MNRRTAIVAGGVALAGAVVLNRYTDLFASSIYRTIRPTAHWAAPDFTVFLQKMNVPQQAAVMESLDMKGKPFGVAKVKEQILWYASNAAEYPFLDKENYNYHDRIVRWAAQKHEVPSDLVNAAPTFVLERKIMEKVFMNLWDTLKAEQRMEVLQRVDQRDTIHDKRGIALGSGTMALAALTAAVKIMGFPFYMLVSSLIHACTAILVKSIPFLVYMLASKTIWVLSGPVGWALQVASGIWTVIELGRANPHKTAAFIIAQHLQKVQILQDHRRLDNVLANLHLISA